MTDGNCTGEVDSRGDCGIDYNKGSTGDISYDVEGRNNRSDTSIGSLIFFKGDCIHSDSGTGARVATDRNSH